MKFRQRLAGSAAAFTIATTILGGLVSTPTVFAAELTPADIAAGTPVAEIYAETAPVVEDSPYWRRAISADTSGRVEELVATSPAMDGREVSLAVIKAPNPGAPTMYMLNGADGGEGGANWIQQTDILDFFLDKNVNVVIPMEGAFSYYTDWHNEQPQLGGKQMWETFLTRELPGSIEGYLQANNNRAIAGMSMSATSSLLFAQHNPGFYDGVGSFSGCAATSNPVGYASVWTTMNQSGTTPETMWGPRGTGTWHYNDALINAAKLRGTELYVSNGSGLAGEWDLPSSPRLQNFNELQTSLAMTETIVIGGAIEAVTNTCTHDLKAKLDGEGIPATFSFRPTGTHSWGYWQQDLWDSWPTFARALGLAE
ncbi:alpha/beta hydrolase [Corynebacterium sp. A21]|uniref:alpha/beta hydrolase n=1 Tax=Corynebacterium sp. A21 TaxID=3457318 RepID=UPI003FD2548B